MSFIGLPMGTPDERFKIHIEQFNLGVLHWEQGKVDLELMRLFASYRQGVETAANKQVLGMDGGME